MSLSSSAGFENDAFFLSSEDSISFGRYSTPLFINRSPLSSVELYATDHPGPDKALFAYSASITYPPPRQQVFEQQDALLSRVVAPAPPAPAPTPAPASTPISTPTPYLAGSYLPGSSPALSITANTYSQDQGALPLVDAPQPEEQLASLSVSSYASSHQDDFASDCAQPDTASFNISVTGYGLNFQSDEILPLPSSTSGSDGAIADSFCSISVSGYAASDDNVSSPDSTITLSGFGASSERLSSHETITVTGYGPADEPLAPTDDIITVTGYGPAAEDTLVADPDVSTHCTSYASQPSSSPELTPKRQLASGKPMHVRVIHPLMSSSNKPDSFTSLPVPTGTNKGYISELVHADKQVVKGNGPSCERDWNGDFQTAMDLLRGLTPNTRHEERVKVYQILARLSEDFVWTVKTYGRIIISEESVPVEEKTIKPVSIGGIAGGHKFIVQGVLFKFALDSAGLYCSDHNAGKAAGHELKSLTHLFNSFVKDLSYPMMAICDYRGFRLIGMTVLPIRGDSTLIFGSSDAGRSVKADPFIRPRLEDVGKRLNLRSHPVGPLRDLQHFYTPLDLEVHRGTDGRYYVLDLARLYPPQSPSLFPYSNKDKATQECAYLFRLLRPEFVRKYSHPLSPDAFSNFGAAPPGSSPERLAESRDCSRGVHEATKFLYTAVIPECARLLTKHEQSNFPEFKNVFQQLVLYLHAGGVNLRFLGMVRSGTIQLGNTFWTSMLLIEMLARLLKDDLKLLLRTEMRRLRSPGEAAYCRALVARLNLLFGSGPDSLAYWKDVLTPEFMVKYPLPMKHEFPSSKSEDLRAELLACAQTTGYGDGRSLLIFRLSELVGLFFIKDTWRLLTRHSSLYEYPCPLHETDLLEMREKISYMNISAHSQGFVLKLLAVNAVDSAEKQRLLQRAKTYFKTALIPNPGNKVTLRNLADCYLECNEDIDAMKCYRFAILADPKDTNSLMKAATLFDKIGLLDDAEDQIGRAHV